MIIGRQVETGFGGRVDLLAIDAVGDLAVLELKRDQTPREVIAQVLEYGSWVVKLSAAELAPIYQKYVERFHPERGTESLDEAFLSVLPHVILLPDASRGMLLAPFWPSPDPAFG